MSIGGGGVSYNVVISRIDLAKYPFIREVAEYVKILDLSVKELEGSEFTLVRERAEQRVNSALIHGVVKPPSVWDEVEIFSFPFAVLFVAKIGDDFLKRRFALAEAKRAYELLKAEDEDGKLVEIAVKSFGWNVHLESPRRFLLSLVDYLRNSTGFHDDGWKLINKKLVKGGVLLGKDEFSRLLQEEVEKHIRDTINNSPGKVELGPSLSLIIERLSKILEERRKSAELEELPKSAVSAAYPPCIKRLYDSLLTGKHISHMGRFTLTAFLLNVGMKSDELTKLYTSLSDFNMEQTQYQVKHIAGEQGGRVKYTPPMCSTLKTHNLCIGTDEICGIVRHPLMYYRRKLRLIEGSKQTKS